MDSLRGEIVEIERETDEFKEGRVKFGRFCVDGVPD